MVFLLAETDQSFAGEYRVVVPDHIGCGLSDKPQEWEYRLAQHIDNCASWSSIWTCKTLYWLYTTGVEQSVWVW